MRGREVVRYFNPDKYIEKKEDIFLVWTAFTNFEHYLWKAN